MKTCLFRNKAGDVEDVVFWGVGEDCAYAHSDAGVLDVTAVEQMGESAVGAVEFDEGKDVGRLLGLIRL